MKSGKISQAVFDRSVYRPLRMAQAIGGELTFGADSARIPMQENAQIPPQCRTLRTALSSGCIGGAADRTPEMILAGAINNLSAGCADCIGVMTAVVLPEDEPESTLKELMQRVGSFCHAMQLTVLGGDTQICEGVTRPVLTVTAIGTEWPQISDRPSPEPCGLVMAGFAGWAGTGIAAAAGYDRLAARFLESLVRAAAAMADPRGLLVGKAARVAVQHGCRIMHDVSVGGVFAALWEMASREQIGFEVDLKAIPIRQETIEVCEQFDLNPYQLYGQGALLIAAADPEGLCLALEAEGICSAVIGSISGPGTQENARVIRSADEVRYLERPQQDALWNWWHTETESYRG